MNLKKKIALLGNGWSNDNLELILQGIKKYAAEDSIDCFSFISYAAWGTEQGINDAQNSIFMLPRYTEFDGVISFSSVLNTGYDTVKKFCDEAMAAGVPVVSIGLDFPGAGFVEMDNETGMRELAYHVYRDCKVKRAIYVGGPQEHPDVRERLCIAREVAAQYGQVIADDDIYYSDWGFDTARFIGHELGKSEKGLPDVIICANDFLALGISSGLLDSGYSLPEDVLLTGFDNVKDGKEFYPALTTVGIDYADVGYQICKWIYDTLDGKNPDRVIHSASKFYVGESTTGPSADYDHERRMSGQAKYVNKIKDSLLTEREGRIEGAILKARQLETLKTSLKWHYEHTSEFEGSSFYLILEKDYFSSVYERRIGIDEVRYAEQKLVLVAVKDGKDIESTDVDRSELIPNYIKDETSHNYFFFPMNVGKYVFGYVVFADNTKILADRKGLNYCARLQQALEKFRSNLYVDMVNAELLEVSITDSLTGLNNRFAYTQLVQPRYQKNREENRRMVVEFIDINFMKVINDKFGHLQGDLALRIVADMIKKVLPENWVALRYGGDEFMVFGEASEDIDPENIGKSIVAAIANAKQEMSLPYDLSVSYGFTVTDDDSEKDLNAYVREADANMYVMKKEIHKNYVR